MKMYCENCRKATEHNKQPTAHFWHFIATLIFMPWIGIWAFSYYTKGYECSECGTVRK